DLDDGVDSPPRVRDQLRAHRSVCIVREPGCLAGAALDRHVEALELPDRLWHECDAVLAGCRLLRHAHAHGARRYLKPRAALDSTPHVTELILDYGLYLLFALVALESM